jgi:DNA (cytosine-5)-methyltransferase 1
VSEVSTEIRHAYLFSQGMGADALLAPLDLVWFAGGGGSSEGAKQALGKSVDYALNHNPVALAMHEANSPQTMHLCADVWDVAPGELEPGRPIRSMWFSPDCTHFSKARGAAPVSERIRGLAFCIVPWARERRPDVIFVENVEEFRKAGPLLQPPHVRAGYPDPDREGEHFDLLNAELAADGYVGEWRELVAADYGAATTRKRLYGVFRRDGLLIVWPARTHAPRKDAARLGLKPWRGFCEVADWSQPCHSIFLTKEEARKAGVKRPLVAATDRRIAKGLDRWVFSREPYIVPITHSSGERRSPPVGEPLGTITTASRGEFALCVPTVTKFHNDSAGVAADEPLPTITANHFRKRPGGAVPLGVVGSTLIRTDMSGAAHSGVFSSEDPVRTMTGAGGFAEVESSLSPFMFGCGGRRGQSPDRSTEEPGPTMTGKGDTWIGAAFLGRQFGSNVTGRSAEDPAPTVMGGRNGGGKTQVVAATLDRAFGKTAPAPADEPIATISGHAHDGMIAASLISYYATGIGSAVDDPVRVITGEDRHAMTAAFLEQANTDMVGHSALDPASTIVGKGCTQRLIEARLQAMGAPQGTRRRQVLEFLWKHFGEPDAADWSDPVGTLQARKRFGLVILAGQVWEIADIGMRMLTVRELFSAQGFPPDYVIDRDHRGQPITKTAATLMVGNSVSPVMARVLYAAQFPDAGPAQRAAA